MLLIIDMTFKFAFAPSIFRICTYLFAFDMIVTHSSNVVEKFQEHDHQINCESWEFQCRNGQCIDESFVCDGSRQCVDGTDETRHQCQSKRCNDTQFRCHYGACIERHHECDGDKQCWDGSDEFPQLCEHVAKIRNRRKRAVKGSCAVPPPSIDKIVKFRCKSESQSCQPTTHGYVPEGTTATVTCASGYSRVGEEEFSDHICTYDSKWRPSIKKCAKICEKLNVSNVNFQCYRNRQVIDNCTENSTLLAGTEIRDVQCKPMYKHVDSPSYFHISCDESGKWDRPLIPCIPKCGLASGNARPTIVGGSQAREGDSPWHVAIFCKKTFICGGTIIHELLVISAAHCFKENSKSVVTEDDYEIVVAKYTNRHNQTDNLFQKMYKIRKIHFCSNGYDGHINYYQGDIAILVVTEKIIMSALVLPACVNWEELKYGKRPSQGTLGKVVGWGLTSENGEASTELNAIYLPLIDTINCKNMVDESFLPYITVDKFCAGTSNHSGPAILQGDSGGGMLLVDNGIHYLHGVASIKQTTSNSISLFTDLRSYIDNILKIREQLDKDPFENATSTNTNQRNQTSQPRITKNLVNKNSAAIAQQYCEKYAEYRYVTNEPTDSSSKGYPSRTMDCLNAIPLFIGGELAHPKEYPHMALIGYGKGILDVEWACGGSLISEKFILGTARCSGSSYRGPPRWVLLGDLNITSNADDDKPAIYGIVKIHDLPKYYRRTPFLGITLYELNTTVTISAYVRPACIHTSAIIPANTRASLTSWIRKRMIPAFERQTTHLRKATLSVLDDKSCLGTNKTVFPKYDPKTMICTDDLKEGKDPGQDDSGGPLQIPIEKQVCMWSILGIASHHGPLAWQLPKLPSQFFRVAPHLDWIQSIVWPQL